MDYYKVNTSTDLGAKLKSLMTEVVKCECSAEEFAGAVGAIAYIGAADVDFGGISAFEFERGIMPNQSLFEQASVENGITWYVPKVAVKEEPMFSEMALQHKGDFEKIVPDTEKTFREIAFMFSRRESAKMAGIMVKQPAIEEMLRKFKISPVEMRMLKSGVVDFRTMFPDIHDGTAERVSQSIKEDKLIMDALGNRKFRIVITISGSRKAVQLYKQLLALPTIPGGMTSALLSIDNPNSRPGIAEFDRHIYVCSGTPSTAPELQKISEEEFLQMKSVLQSSVSGNVVGQA